MPEIQQSTQNTETVDAVEYKLLLEVFAQASDLVLAGWSQEFCDACGGFEKIARTHAEAVRRLEQWYAEGDG